MAFQNLNSAKMEEISKSIEANTAEDYTQYEYEAQHFGFSPITLMNGMYNSVSDLYRDALKAFCTKLLTKYPDVMTEQEVSKARHEMGQKIDSIISDIFDKMEIVMLESVFTLPADCVLPKDACQLTQRSPEEQNAVDEKKNELRKKILAVKYANAVLSQQLKLGDIFAKGLKESLDSLESFSNITGGNSMKDWISYFNDSILTAFGSSSQEER